MGEGHRHTDGRSYLYAYSWCKGFEKESNTNIDPSYKVKDPYK